MQRSACAHNDLVDIVVHISIPFVDDGMVIKVVMTTEKDFYACPDQALPKSISFPRISAHAIGMQQFKSRLMGSDKDMFFFGRQHLLQPGLVDAMRGKILIQRDEEHVVEFHGIGDIAFVFRAVLWKSIFSAEQSIP